MTTVKASIVAVLLSVNVAVAQNPGYLNQNNETGTPAYGSYSVTGIDSVNLGNGGVSLKIPLLSREMRGFDITVGLRYDSKFWNDERHYSGGSEYMPGTVSHVWRQDMESGWQVTDSFSSGLAYTQQDIPCPALPGWTDWEGHYHPGPVPGFISVYSNFIYQRGDGTKYRFPNRMGFFHRYPNVGGDCHQYQTFLDSNIIKAHTDSGQTKLDLAGFSETELSNTQIVLANNYKLNFADGTSETYVFGDVSKTTQDTNGNFYRSKEQDADGWRLDNLGRRLYRWQFDPARTDWGNINQFQYLDSYGSVQTIVVEYGNTTVFPQFPTTEYFYQPTAPGPMRVLKKITLPNGRAYVFSYENPDQPGTDNPFGEVTKITLPTGGYVRYKYAAIPQRDFLQPLETDIPANGNYDHLDARVLVERAENADGGAENVWHYSYTYDFQGNAATTTVTDPNGDREIHYFDYWSPTKPIESRVEFYQGATLVRTIAKTWGGDAGPVTANQPSLGDYPDWHLEIGERNLRILRVTTTLNDTGQSSKAENDYSDCYAYSVDGRTYTDCRNNVTEKREYDYGATAPTRSTKFTYLHQQNPNYNTAHIWDHLTDKQTYAGTVQGGTLKAETVFAYDSTGLTSTSGVPNHNTVSSPRANQTEVKSWRNTDNAWLTSTTTYDDVGNVRKTADSLGHETNLFYDDDWANTSCAASGNTFAYLTKTTNALNHEVRNTYNSCNGTLASSKDQNDINAGRSGTTYSYDFMGRLITQNFPDGGRTEFSYADTGAVQVNKRVWQNVSGAGVQTGSELDGLGRIKRTTLGSGSCTIAVDTMYDSNGRVHSVTNPFCSTSEPTYGVTTTAYDALGRWIGVTKQDGSAVASNYSGNTVTVTDEAGKQRRTYSDALGRLIRVDEPGPSGQLIQAATPGSGTATVNGSLQSVQNQTQTAAPGMGSVTISGELQSYRTEYCHEEYVWNGDDWVNLNVCEYETYYDGGSVSITVNGSTKSVPYGANGGENTAPTIASQLAQAINADWTYPVTAQVSFSTIYLTAKGNGAATNYALSAGASNTFPTPSFSATTSGPTLTGGRDNAYATIYDSGTVSITVGATTKSTAYGQGDTANSVANRLSSGFNGDSSAPVTAAISGAMLIFTSKTTGAATNYTMTSTSSTSQAQYFAQPSFTTTRSGNSLTGGQDQIVGGGLTYPWTTLYTYDALDNLTCVEQHGDTASGSGCSADPANDATSPWRVRRFTYNSLGQLLTAKNPESGTITYAYDDDGNVTSKTSPAPNQAGAATLTVNYAYDALHRLTGKSYSNGDSAVAYLYDQSSYNGLAIGNGIGRRTGMSDASGQTGWSYDAMGRALKERRTIAGVTKELAYEYNLDGSAKKLTYPSGAVMNFAYDSAGRLLSAIDPANNLNYAQSAAYTPAGALSALTLGNSGSFAGYTLANTYNNRLQPTLLSAAKPGATLFSRFYSYGAAQQNNGNISQITDNLVADRSVSYTYDQLNRIASAQSTGTDCSAVSGAPALTKNWGNSYTIDPWGNLTAKSVIKCSSESLSTTVNAKNQLGIGTHDAAGNLLSNGGATYSYDAENRIATTAAVTYTYDGDSVRVKKSSGTLYFGESFTDGPITETDLSGTIKAEYLYFGGKRVARRDLPTGAIHYYFSDHLGSASLVASATGTIEEDSDFYPYGGERAYLDTLPDQNYKFTSKQRDPESGLDYFGARYYGNNLGRFLTPDWADSATAVPYADFGDPQSLNLYGYVRNNPLAKVDADGHEIPSPDLNWDRLSGIAEGVGSFAKGVVQTVAQVASGEPGTHQLANDVNEAVSYGLKTSFSSEGRETMATQWNALDDQGKAAVASETLLTVVSAGLLTKAGSKTGESPKPYELTPENVKRMDESKPPIGKDGHPVELHHPQGNPKAQVKEMTRTEHRLGPNYRNNHPDTNQKTSQINRSQAAKERKAHWKAKAAEEKTR